MRRETRWLKQAGVALAATAVVVVAMLWLSGALRRGKIQPPPGPAVLAPQPAAPSTRHVVQAVTRPQIAAIVGSVQAERRTAVSSRLVANINEMRVRAGDQVSAGDVIVLLDDRDLRARVGQIRQSLRAAEVKRELAKVELDRVEQMYAQKAATDYERELRRSEHNAALADVSRFQEAVAEAEVALSDTQIRAPISGIVIDRQADPGDQASPGRPLLTIYDPARLRLEASVREADIGRLHVGQPLGVIIDALAQERVGRVQEIVPLADPSSRSVLVKVQLEDSRQLYPGMFGRLLLPLDPRRRLEIPRTAVRYVGQLSLVDVDADGRPQRRSVRLGASTGESVEVLAGLREGETVLVPSPQSSSAVE